KISRYSSPSAKRPLALVLDCCSAACASACFKTVAPTAAAASAVIRICLNCSLSTMTSSQVSNRNWEQDEQDRSEIRKSVGTLSAAPLGDDDQDHEQRPDRREGWQYPLAVEGATEGLGGATDDV